MIINTYQITVYLGLIMFIIGIISQVRLKQQIFFLIGGGLFLYYHIFITKDLSMIVVQCFFIIVPSWEIIKLRRKAK